MRKLTLLVLLSCVLVASLGCRPSRSMITPSHNIVGYNASLENVRAAIFRACTVLTWRPKDKDATTITASIVVRNKHTVVVEIPYTTSSYSINYVHSVNMEASPTGKIHPNYNNWVIRLANKIDQELALQNI